MNRKSSPSTRRQFCTLAGKSLLGGIAALAPSAPGFTAAAQQKRRPNILFILADDLGYGELGCYGQTMMKTPNLDRLAAEGTRFTQCYSGSTVCAPSRCCLLTGLHTGHASVRGNGGGPMPDGETTVAEALKGAGYATAVIGKWGMGQPGTPGDPKNHGFDLFYGYHGHTQAHNSFPEFLWRNDKKETLAGNENDGQKVYAPDLFTKEALEFIRTNREKPFFLYLNYIMPHANSTGRRIDAPRIEPEYADTDWPEVEKKYASTITRMDKEIGRVREELAKLGLADDTIIFFTSDNGPHREGQHSPDFFDSNGALKGVKRDLYEGGIRVPMIVCAPGRVPAGKISEQVWYFPDFLPTAAALIGVEPPKGIDGISIAPALLSGNAGVEHPPLYWEFHERGFEQAVRLGDWKAVRHGTTLPIELYDMKQDKEEKTDVAAQNPQIVAKVKDFLASARTDSARFPIREGEQRRRRNNNSGGTARNQNSPED